MVQSPSAEPMASNVQRNESRRVGLFSKPSSTLQPPTLVLVVPDGSRHHHQISGLGLQTPSSTVAEYGDDARMDQLFQSYTNRSLSRSKSIRHLQREDDDQQTPTGSPTPSSEILAENRSLHQRIAAMQRTELDLLNENRKLSRKLTAAQQHYEVRRDQWKEEWLNREKAYKDRIKALEARVVEQERELQDVLDHSQGPIIRMQVVTA
ncbi:hypothetical protein QBC38DRAFT_125818 [Podospora fimiseda]|uniref:Uncharacterized protein n=1 Tax=Podospora fimiseda TaxID=252190 RepID=A0AAN6YNB7_9PEZI|nr:hypothetical protein QBC38DRAFT_125818 [Podospora fimiseda]